MTWKNSGRAREGRPAALTVGLFGGLGSGNIGNDASLEAMLSYLRTDHPEAVLDAMCGGPDLVRARYGIPARSIHWAPGHQSARGLQRLAVKALRKPVDAVRIAGWVRRHDVVIVPGMGILETGLPVRPWQFPYLLFVLSVAGRVFRTRVALVSVGANVINQRMTRWLLCRAARLACYRSYRDALSREAMRQMGQDVTADHVFTDLAFALPAVSAEPGDPRTVGVGVMDYYGSNDESRRHAAQRHATYVAALQDFVLWLVDSGRRVRLFVGDTNGSDDRVLQSILAGLQEARPGLGAAQVTAEPVRSYGDLMRAMAPASTVVATRYHNVICALKLGKPTISISYAQKNTALMTAMGLSAFCQDIGALDGAALIGQLNELERQAPQLRTAIARYNAELERAIAAQFAELTAVLFPVAGRRPARRRLAGR